MAEKRKKSQPAASAGDSSAGKKTKKQKKVEETSGKKASLQEKKIKTNPAGSRIRDEIMAILMVALGIFLIVALFTSAAGQVGGVLSTVLKGCFGLVAYLLPFCLIAYALLLLMEHMAHINSRTIFFSLLMYLDLAVLNAARFEQVKEASFHLSWIREMFREGVVLQSAGAIGMTIGWGIVRLVDIAGLIIIGIVVLIICGILIANTPISEFFDRRRIRKNQKRIDALEEKTESGTADPKRDTAPVPVVRDEEVKRSGSSAPAGSSPEAASSRGRSAAERRGGSQDEGRTHPASESRRRRETVGKTGSKDRSDRSSMGENKRQILSYMNDDQLFREDSDDILGMEQMNSEERLEEVLSWLDGNPPRGKKSREEKTATQYGLPKSGNSSEIEEKQTIPEDPSSGLSGGEPVSTPSKKKGIRRLTPAAEEFWSVGDSRQDKSSSRDTAPIPSAENRPSDEITSSTASAGGSSSEPAEKDPPMPVERKSSPSSDTGSLPEAASEAVPAAAAAASAGKKKVSSVPPAEIGETAGSSKRVYELPPIDLLNPSHRTSRGDGSDLRESAELLERVLHNFGVAARVVDVNRGPSVTRFEIQPDTGVKVSSIVHLSDDIALNLRARSLRIEAPIPGKAAIGIEVQNDVSQIVSLRELIESSSFQKMQSKIGFVVGEDITGSSVVADLRSMPHMLIAGSTGSGKSVCINSIIMSMLYKATPDEVRLILIDPKVVELSNYNGIPHMLIPVVTDPSKAAAALAWAVQEMEKRYKKFADAMVRDLKSFNDKMRREEKQEEVMPQIVIIIDELADLMMAAGKQVEESICRLAQLARAAGMHMIVATQRPSVDVVTGLIKANVPSRIAFAVSSQVDSRTILDRAGAEKLVGKGDMLFSPLGSAQPQRIQGPFVTDEEIEAVLTFWKEQADDASDHGAKILGEINTVKADFDAPESEEDPLFDEAVDLVLTSGQASASMLQRRFRIGYNRAGRLVDIMEARGIIGPSEGSRPRKVLLTKDEYYGESDDAESEETGTVEIEDASANDSLPKENE